MKNKEEIIASKLRAIIIGNLKTRYPDEFLSNETKYVISEDIAKEVECLYDE